MKVFSLLPLLLLVLLVLVLLVVYVVYVYVIGFLFLELKLLSLVLAALTTARGGLTLFFLFSLRSLTASKVHRVHGPFPLPLIELVRFDVVASFTVLDV